MSHTLENKLLNLAQVFALIDNNNITLKEGAKLLNYSYWHFIRLYHHYQSQGLSNLFQKERKKKQQKLKIADIALHKEHYLKLEKPQLSLLCYFLYLDYPSFQKISSEWIRKTLIKENIYSAGIRGKVFRKRFEAPATRAFSPGRYYGISMDT